MGGLGNAASLGPLSVPANWTSVIPTLNGGAISGLPNAGLDAANAAPTVLGAAPRGALAGAPRSPGPRYGVVPTIMSRRPPTDTRKPRHEQRAADFPDSVGDGARGDRNRTVPVAAPRSGRSGE
ncbi:PE/PPE C-terminal domain-containing protein [Mycobacterium ulcerans]